MRNKILLLLALFLGGLGSSLYSLRWESASASVPGNNTLVSAAYGGTTTTGNVGSSSPSDSVSGDGRYVVFSSSASNLTSGYTSRTNVFVRDLKNNVTTVASVSSSGVAEDSTSVASAISHTGRYVLFTSTATNLIDGTTISSSSQQLYMRDRATNTTTLLSKNSSGTPANATVFGWAVSSDGRFVLMSTPATNLGPTITNTGDNLLLLDRSTNTFTIVNTSYNGSQVNNSGPNRRADMSCDGSLIVFDSASNLVASGSGHYDVYLVDLRNGRTITAITASANGAGFNPHISCNGDYVGFSTYANNLDANHLGATQYNHDYVYNRTDGSFTIADQSSSGTLATVNTFDPNGGGTTGTNYNMAISDNGIVAFGSTATNIDSSATTGNYQVFVHNLNDGTTYLLSKNSSGTESNNSNNGIAISTDGKVVSYSSYSTNLISGTDSSGSTDVFTSDTGY